jgi:hypothetical protein
MTPMSATIKPTHETLPHDLVDDCSREPAPPHLPDFGPARSRRCSALP